MTTINNYSFILYSGTKELPDDWDLFTTDALFLSTAYLKVLEISAPKNMVCHFIGVFKEKTLVGVVISQMISMEKISTFGRNRGNLKLKIRDFVLQRFAKNTLFIGNNMLTGQNAFNFNKEISDENKSIILNEIAIELEQIFKKRGKKISITSFKDFSETDIKRFKKSLFKDYYVFDTQPNMIFTIPKNWFSVEDYIAALSKKYRNQYNRARKKAEEIVKCKLSLEDMLIYNEKIMELYSNVTKNARFNTFYLNENHFIEFKKKLGHNFLFYGYFIEDELIGFNTLIKNKGTIVTYFLGYNEDYQRDKMLYVNMLYDMIAYSINKNFNEIIFARTALEIKSSVGAKPLPMFGLIKHNNPVINKLMPQLFKYFEPKIVWQERNPFKLRFKD